MRRHRVRRVVTVTLAWVLIVGLMSLPASALGVAPTTAFTDPLDGRGFTHSGGADGWWVVAPFVTLTSDQDGTLYWRWDSGPETAVAVTAGNGYLLPDPAPEGDHTLVAYSVNSIGETETPPGVYRRYVVDTQEPGQPAPFSATLVPGIGVQLDWGASADDPGGSGLLGYYIYRKTGLPPFTGYRLPVVVPAGTTTYLDSPPGSVDDYIYAVSAVDAAGNESYLSEIDPTPTLVTVYRFYNVRTGTHLYTASEAERDAVLRDLSWAYSLDGPAYHAYGTPTGVVPLHRFYNVRTGTHFYTAVEPEVVALITNLGWLYRYEGIAYHVSTSPAGTIPVHRFYNFRTGAHFFTASDAEKASVQANLAWTYAYEGVAFHVLP